MPLALGVHRHRRLFVAGREKVLIEKRNVNTFPLEPFGPVNRTDRYTVRDLLLLLLLPRLPCLVVNLQCNRVDKRRPHRRPGALCRP